MKDYLGTEPRFIEIKGKLINPNMIMCIGKTKLLEWDDKTERSCYTGRAKVIGINTQNEEGYETRKYLLRISMIDKSGGAFCFDTLDELNKAYEKLKEGLFITKVDI